MALEDMITNTRVSIVGDFEEIEGEQFEIIKHKAEEIQNATGLVVGVYCFNANYHREVEYPVYYKDKLIGYETHKDGEVIAMRGVNDKT